MTQKIDSEGDFRWAFYMNVPCLVVFGIWPSKENKLEILLILAIVVFGATSPCIYAFIQVYRDLNLAIDNMLITIPTLMSAGKVALLWLYRPTCRLLIKWAKSDWCRYNENWQRELMLKQARRGRLLGAVCYVMMFTHANCFILSPIFNFGIRMVNNITDPDPQHILPIQTYYPFDYYKSPYYELVYLSQIISICCAGWSFQIPDLLFMSLVFHASGQSEILAEKMSQLCDRQANQSFASRLRELIESHNQLVRFVTAIEDSFSTAIFMQMFGSMLIVSGTGYALIKAYDEASTTGIMQLVVLVAAILNVNEYIMVYCLTCEILASNSMEMFDAIYNSRWHDLPAKEARCIILIMAQTQQPLQLSAGKFFYLSLNAYAQIFKSTAGYISMLLAVN